VTPPRSVNGSGGLSGRVLTVTNVQFGTPSFLTPSQVTDIDMDRVVSDSLGTSNFGVTDQVFVYSYDGTSTDNFQAFYTQVAGSSPRSRVHGFVISL
jgi:hypothetical protein